MAHQVRAGPTGPTGGSRRRRPVGEPPPLPATSAARRRSLVAAFLVLATGGFASFGRGFATGPGLWLLIVVRWGTVVALIVWKRWRHLAVFVGSVALVSVAVQRVVHTAEIAGVSRGPAFAAASLAVTFAGVVYGPVPAGRRRWFAKIVSAAICLVVAVVSILDQGEHTRRARRGVRDRVHDPHRRVRRPGAERGVPRDVPVRADRAHRC